MAYVLFVAHSLVTSVASVAVKAVIGGSAD